MVKSLSTSLQSLRALLARADAVLERRHPGDEPLERADLPEPAREQDGWDDTLALVISAREQIERGEERIAALQAHGRELEEHLAEEVTCLTARLGDMDARYASIDAARTAAEQRESRARERLATAMQFYAHMNQTLRTALRRSRLLALRDEAEDRGDEATVVRDERHAGASADEPAGNTETVPTPATEVEVFGRDPDGVEANAARDANDERSDTSAAR
jgi:DNA repair exonuclease SbcCD ATPase subunit